MDEDNTCIYTSANDDYAIYAAISMLSVRKFCPKISLFLLSSSLSSKTKIFLDSHDIKYIEKDYSSVFYQTWQYPIECYYIFIGPEIFQGMGYKYSVYMDGDILCCDNPLKIDNFNIEKKIYGVASGETGQIFGNDIENICHRWNMPHSMSRQRINSGVVYFNNHAMSDAHLLQCAGTLFDESVKSGIPRKGDDSLLALFCVLLIDDQDLGYLPNIFNYIPDRNHFKCPSHAIVFFHFCGRGVYKPWRRLSLGMYLLSIFITDLRRLDIFRQMWRFEAKELLSAAEYRKIIE